MNASLSDKERKQVSTIYEEWQKGYSYLKNMNLTENIPLCVDFMEGRQWRNPKNNKTKNLPRMVFNAINMIISSKMSNILGTPIKINYIAYNNRVNTERFSHFSEYIDTEIGVSKYRKRVVKESLVKGTGLLYWYWDDKAIGKKGNFEGALRCKIVDPLNITVADPSEDDIQKQRYIIFYDRMDIDSVKKMCSKKKYKELIEEDNEDNVYSNHHEVDNSKLVTVFTKLFKRDGEVYFQHSTKQTILHEPKPLNPMLNEKMIKAWKKKMEEENKKVDLTNESINDALEDGANISIQDTNINRSRETDYKFFLYPITKLVFQERDGSFYGISEVSSMIEVQKALNFLPGCALLNNQKHASPTYVFKKNAIRGQKVTNDFNEYLIDYSEGNTRGIDIIQPQNLSEGALTLAPTLLDFLRTVTNSTEVITGETIAGKDLSGVAIQQLQAQANKPIEMYQNDLWDFEAENGKIKELFYKFYYDNKKYSYQMDTTTINELKRQRLFVEGTNYRIEDTFNGNEFLDIDFDIAVEVGAGTKNSEIQTMAILDFLLQQRLIDVKTYTKFIPQKIMSFKDRFLEDIEEQEQTEINQLKEVVNKQNSQLEELSAYIDQLAGANKKLDYDMKYAKEEFARKIKEADKINKDLMDKLNKSTKNDNSNEPVA